ncbi:hypothetical protein ACH3XW_19510 [Acanthocheilonema viteae]
MALDGGPDSMLAVSKKYQPVSAQLESCLKHLENLGLDHNVEDKLVRFEDTIIKMIDFRTSETVMGRTAEPLYAVNPLEVQACILHGF